MKIYQCCPYYNEQLIADLNLEEASKWIDEFHVTEGNKSFQNIAKKYNFIDNNISGKLRYHKLDCEDKFVSNDILGKLKLAKYRFNQNQYKKSILISPTWYNDAIQRDQSSKCIRPNDDDIVILSDIDEIIDSRFADKIIEEVKKRQIVTIKLHFTLFYFNLVSTNWGGAEDYSYRVFIMTGKYFNSMQMSSDELRKLGEQGKLYDEVYCIDEVCGFHHSWLGDENFILNKIKSYAHTEHAQFADIDYIKQCLKEQKSIFPGHELKIRDDIKFVKSIEDKRETKLNAYFL